MAKNLHKTPRIGLLTDTERKAIKDKKISKDMRWNLTNPKKGILPVYFKQMVEDFSLILESGEFDNWIENYLTVQSITRLAGKLDDAFSFSVMPRSRLASTIKEGQRKFCLKQIDYKKTRRTDLKKPSYILEQFTKGLKPNEKLFLYKYVAKIGFNLPFNEGIYYTWEQVKDMLEQQMAPPPPPSDEIKEIFRKRMDRAWEMIFEKIDPQTKSQIIKETGFWIRLLLYSSII